MYILLSELLSGNGLLKVLCQIHCPTPLKNYQFTCHVIFLVQYIISRNERGSSYRNKLAFVPIKDSDKPAHLCRLIRVFHGWALYG